MKPEDFPQFDDPRVREVMAAAANLVEDIYKGRSITISADALKTALFAAQHSRPKEPSPLWQCGNSMCSDGRDMLCGECAEVIAWLDAQHSASRATCQECGGPGYHYPQCAQHSKPKTHEHPVEFDKWGYSKPVTNRFNVDGSKPGGKAFIAAVEHAPTCMKCEVDGPENCWDHKP